eukprot:CAMPEP_0117677820 /NCGR_PEP_ID=MMETSP0804-20121206/16947_1 /TAXON_ID=1074897 /ORGANISM="Tetraselmis astigmatica, Strain CCMP880" /LENGTH=160 /DNA_ID=CAMNT_0005487125 /DNA_START=59 /DNA_END=541 /DNA_ORIENTATION=-
MATWQEVFRLSSELLSSTSSATAARAIAQQCSSGLAAAQSLPARALSTSQTGGDETGPVPSPVDFATLSADKASYQKILDDARHRIFGTHIGNGERSGRKVLKKALVAERMADYYMERLTKAHPIFADPKDEQKRQKLATLKRRGKGPPAKGQGKRSKKR